MLSQEKLDYFREKLLAEQKRIQKELSGFASKDGEGYKADYVDFGNEEEDNAEEFRQHEVNLSLEKRLEHELGEIKDALVRIEQGKYGICEKDGSEIQEARLEAYPAARFSIQNAE